MSTRDSRPGPNQAFDATEAEDVVRTGRRDFLKLAGLSFAAISMPEALVACGGTPATTEKLSHAVSAIDLPVNESNWIVVVRPTDLLRLRFNFVQMHEDTASKTLVLDSAASPGIILVELPPQHVLEPAVAEPVDGSPPTSVPPLPIDARISPPTRLAFYVPPGSPPIGYDLEALLDACKGLGLNTADNAVPTPDDVIPAPIPSAASTDPEQAIANLQASARTRAFADVAGDALAPADFGGTGSAPQATLPPSQTAIELPYRVVLSPSSKLRFAHATQPAQSSASSRTELWTTRLARANASGVADETTAPPISVRAVASRDLAGPLDPFPLASLTSTTRAAIARQSSDYSAANNGNAIYPIRARHMLLSARGGSLDSVADFGSSPPQGLLDWQHRASIGRDAFVRVELAGYLFPWLHRASLVTISERKFLATPSGGAAGPRTAFLWQRQFIVVRTPVVSYPFSLDWPMKGVRIVTLTTPPIDLAPTQPATFWPTINGVAYRFAAQFIDLEDNVTESTLSAIWVPEAGFTPNYDTLKNDFETTTDPGLSGALRCVSDFQRQRVAYARTSPAPGPGLSSTLGKTTLETRHVTVGAHNLSGAPPPPPPPPPPQIQASVRGAPFLPYIRTTEINIPSLRQFSGSDAALVMEYPPAYLGPSGEFGSANPGEVFLSLVAGSAPLSVDFGAQSQRAGAFLTPNMSVVGLSRQIGPIAGKISSSGDVATQIANFASGAAADPKLLFGGLAGTKLFGVFTLADLFGGSLPLDHLPSFVTETLDTIGTVVRTVNQVQSALADLQNAASSLSPTPPALASVLAAATGFGNDVTAFVQYVSVLPPTDPPATFVSTALAKLTAIQADVTSIQASFTAARAANPGLPVGQRLADGAFALLDSLLRSVSGALSSVASSGGELETALQGIAAAAAAVSNMSSRFDWKTKPGDVIPIGIPGVFSQIFNPSASTVLEIIGEVRAHEVAGKPAGMDLTATLNNFDINLLGMGTVPTPNNPSPAPTLGNLPFIALSFDHLSFKVLAGQKPDIDVAFSGITFEGPLSFLNALKSIIPLDGFGDPPGITVDASGIHGDFTLALPSLAVGVLAIENLSLGASFDIPFIGQPMTVGFHFCERENPFHLTVMFLGGGGYFLLDLSMQGVVLVEAALEFGAEASIDLVVASGSVCIMAGIYFSYVPTGVTLTGYVRIAGSLSVLGLITASVEMRLDLGYKSVNGAGAAFGKATITIEVSIMFFSASVDVSCEKTFSSCNGDPTFADAMGPESPSGLPASAWDDYCAAFAA